MPMYGRRHKMLTVARIQGSSGLPLRHSYNRARICPPYEQASFIPKPLAGQTNTQVCERSMRLGRIAPQALMQSQLNTVE
jgi:hypothetical protein